MGEHRSMVLRRFAPINQEGDIIDLDSVDYGQYIDIAILRSILWHASPVPVHRAESLAQHAHIDVRA